ncbi:uncharacterized protein LOC123921842 isoform X2 [Trifolium pratense]|uniref:uncharacterized protein LOC123921842 isoform X2 n=1 Tax=Trifolium pratense TaxID=57577 RepID=UPI001E691C20|nr:uncharacterized protein LOC123921842 isoform X2 [Trifolium pratense]
MLSSRRHTILTNLTSSFHSLNRRFSMCATSSPLVGGNVDANVMPDNPLSDISDDREKDFIAGTSSPETRTFSFESKLKRKIRVDLGLEQGNKNDSRLFSGFDDNISNTSAVKTLSVTENFTRNKNKSTRQSHFWKKDDAASSNRPYNNGQRKTNFDICCQRNSTIAGATLLEKNEENGIEFKIQEGATHDVILRPGMVLLKHHLTHDEQVEIVKQCRSLGLGPGGFYQPGYAGGAKLRLKMMCLGMDWDPQTRKYGYKRAIDGCKAPSIPHYFSNLVIRAIQEAHNLINQESGISYVEDILPSMTPDICIANFYETSGRLGLHQDRDESRESLRKGLPVVSFSIGDSAEFLYGDQRNVEKAESVFLESGDVLIFGGESRHVYHGVSSIIPNSAPEELLRDTCLCPGRLNLTFRQY